MTLVFLNQKRVNVREHTIKTAPRELRIVKPGWSRHRKREGVEGMERKLNGNYLRLIPRLCVEFVKQI